MENTLIVVIDNKVYERDTEVEKDECVGCDFIVDGDCVMPDEFPCICDDCIWKISDKIVK